jgi:hypothetical protein
MVRLPDSIGYSSWVDVRRLCRNHPGGVVLPERDRRVQLDDFQRSQCIPLSDSNHDSRNACPSNRVRGGERLKRWIRDPLLSVLLWVGDRCRGTDKLSDQRPRVRSLPLQYHGYCTSALTINPLKMSWRVYPELVLSSTSRWVRAVENRLQRARGAAPKSPLRSARCGNRVVLTRLSNTRLLFNDSQDSCQSLT